MCGHIFLGHQNYQLMSRPQTLWRCSVCGRQSHLPLDCCTQPNYHLCQSNKMVYTSFRWIGTLMRRMQTHFQSWWFHHRQLEVEITQRKDKQSPAHKSIDALLSDIEVLAKHNDLTEDIQDDVRELQLR